MTRGDQTAALALAAYFASVQFYTSLQALSPTPQVGFALVGRSGALALVALLAVSGLACGKVAWRARRAASAGPSRAMLALWLGAVVVAALFGFAPLEGVQVALMMLLGAAFHLALVERYGRPGVAKFVVGAYLAAGSVAAAAGIAMVLLRAPAGLYASAHGRAAGPFVSANQFAEFLSLFVFVALGAGLAAPGGRLRALAFGGAALGAVALLLTFSRESWAGAVAGAVFLAFALGRRTLGIAVLAGAMLAGGVLATRPFPHHDPSDTFSRLHTVQAGLRVVALFPLTGIGPVEYWRAYGAVRPVNGPLPGTFGALHPHDVYVSLAGELGLAGLGAVALGWLRFARTIRDRLAAVPPAGRRFTLGICAGLVAMFVAGTFDAIGTVQMTFVWIPYTGLALAAAGSGSPWESARA